MSRHVDLANRAALSLIDADARLFFDLALNPRLEPIRPIAILALMPFMSAFLYETIRYVKQVNPEAVQELQSHQDLLRASRVRMKLLDDNRRSLEAILENATEMVVINRDWFFRDHRGILRTSYDIHPSAGKMNSRKLGVRGEPALRSRRHLRQ